MIKECYICKKQFDGNPRALTCSDECKRQRLRDTSNNWKKNNKEKNKQITKEWRDKNKQHTKEYNSNYHQTNKHIIQPRHAKRAKERRETDILFKLSHTCRSRIRKFYVGEHKKNDLIGCSWDFLNEWILYLNSSCTIENHGFNGWHLDHIIPISSFNLENENELKKCFHWSNLQPLNGIENMSKSDKILKEEIEQHKIKLIEFCKIKKIPVPNF